MAANDWFRRTTWSEADKADFHARLKRSHLANRPQFLRIQATHLAEVGLFAASIELLDLYFKDYPDRMGLAVARLQKAECLVALNQSDTATIEFRASLQAERDFPKVRTECWLVFPWFIAHHKLVGLYNEALAILGEFENDSNLIFPVQRYRYGVVRAVIADERGDHERAREFAVIAIKAAEMGHSGFQYHSTVGLVGSLRSEFHERLIELAR